MAFENIGVGGTLSFDSGNAVSNMGRATAAFTSMSGASARFKSGLSDIASGLSRFNLLGGALGLLGGISFAGLIREAVTFRSEMENVNLSIATTLSAVQSIPLDQGLEQARGIMEELRVAAIATPAELADLANIFKQTVGPMQNAGSSMQDILQMTQNAANAAIPLGMRYEDLGNSLFRMISGQAEMDNRLVAQLKSMGLMTETTKEWKALLPEDRIRRIQEMMGTMGAAGERAALTFTGLLSTFSDLRKSILDAFFGPVLERFRQLMISTNTTLADQVRLIQDRAKVLGERLVPVFEFLVRRGRDVWDTGKQIIEVIQRLHARAQAAFGAMGFDVSNFAENLGTIAAKILTIAVVVTPVITAVMGLASQLGGVLMILRGVAAVATGPVGIALFALGVVGVAAFRHMREEGITLQDVWVQLRGGATGFANYMTTVLAPAQARFIGMWEKTKSAVLDVFEGATPALENYRSRMENTFGNQLRGITSMANAVSGILASAWDIVLTVVDALRPTINDVIIAVGVIQEEVAAVWAEVGILMEKLTRLVEPIVNFLLPGLHGMYTILGTIASFVVTAVKGAFVGVFGVVRSMLQIFGSIVDLLTGDTTAAIEGLRHAMGTLGSAIIRAVHSPLQKVAEILVQITSALAAVAPAPLQSTLRGMTEALQRVATITPEQAAAAFGFESAPSVGGRRAAGNLRGEVTAATREARSATQRRSRAAAQQTPPPPSAEQPCVEANLDVTTRVNVDGREVAGAVSRHQQEISDRAGYSQTPWQRRRVQTRGVPGGQAR